jgi:hypothetical protein
MEMQGLYVLIGYVLATWVALIAVDLVTLACTRAGILRSNATMASMIVLGLVAAGMIAIILQTGKLSLDVITHVAGVCLFLALSIVYIEARSLLSRGYSLRILADLSKAGGHASVAQLKSSYGDGKGLSGLIAKRLETLASFKLLLLERDQAGPLTALGKTLALIGLAWRKTLRLEHVG